MARKASAVSVKGLRFAEFPDSDGSAVVLTLADDSAVTIYRTKDGDETVIRRSRPNPDAKQLPPAFSPELLPPLPETEGIESVEFRRKN